MSRHLSGLILAGVCTGALLASCSSTPAPAVVPVPAGLPAPTAGLPTGKTVWRRDVLAGAEKRRLVRGWIKGGMVIFETNHPSLICLDLATGSERFGLLLNRPLMYEPICDGEKLVALTMDRLYVVKALTGTIMVDRHLDIIPAGTPACTDDSVYLTTLDGNRVVSFDCRTGRQGWSWTNGQAPVGGAVVCTAAGRRKTLVVYTDRGNLYGLNCTGSGQAGPRYPLWEMKGGVQAEAEVAVRGNTAFVASSDHHLYTVDAGSGHSLWVHAAGVPLQGMPLVAREKVFTQAGEELVCLALATGRRLWGFTGYVQVVKVDPDVLWVTTSDNRLVRMGLADGKVQGTWLRPATSWLGSTEKDLLLGWDARGRVVAIRQAP